MAQQAVEHPTPIKDPDDLLRCLTEELGYEKYAALWEMEQKYLDGELKLTKREYRIDGTPYGDAIPINANFGHIELDRRGRVWVVPLIPLWREVCDARAIWPHPPASQTAPDGQSEDKTDGWQVRRVKQVLRELFPPDGHPPADMLEKTVRKRVNEIFKPQGWKLASLDSVARAMGRRRA